MISAYASILQYQYDDWEEYFTKILLIDIFKPIVECYKEDHVKLKCAISFILHCYSLDSEKVILGQDWQKNKQAIFEDTCTPMKDLYEDLVLLKNDAVVSTIHNWLRHQDSPVHEELCVLKELKMEMQLSANAPIRKSSGEIDYTQKYLNTGYAFELRQKIRELEQELIQNNVRLKQAISEVRIVNKPKNTLKPENYAK